MPEPRRAPGQGRDLTKPPVPLGVAACWSRVPQWDIYRVPWQQGEHALWLRRGLPKVFLDGWKQQMTAWVKHVRRSVPHVSPAARNDVASSRLPGCGQSCRPPCRGPARQHSRRCSDARSVASSPLTSACQLPASSASRFSRRAAGGKRANR